MLFLPGEEVRLREHALAGEVVGKGDPALLRFRGEAVHLLPGDVQHGGAGDARAVEEGGEALEEALVLQERRQLPPAVGEVLDRGLGGQAAQKACAHLPELFLVHGGPSFCSADIMH